MASKRIQKSRARKAGKAAAQLDMFERPMAAQKRRGGGPGEAARAGASARAGEARGAGAGKGRSADAGAPRAAAPAPAAAAPAGATATAAPPAPPRPPAPPPSRRGRASRRATAESMAQQQREISVSEFFTKNRHLLGFDNPGKALLTTVKEGVDNALDACEEAGILPELRVEVHELAESRFRVVIDDNGPGIVKAQVPKVFGRLLYGSKFHRLRQSRGQQGIGISAAGMYAQLTTGKAVAITSKTGKGKPAHHFEIVIDTAKNQPVVARDDVLEWERDHGTRVEMELEATYKGGRRSVDEYLELVALANPHARVVYQPPRERPAVVYDRVAAELPREPHEIKPHPYGVELGALAQILKGTRSRWLRGALSEEFCRVSPAVADAICAQAGVSPTVSPRRLALPEVERVHKAIPRVRIIAPPLTCVVPIGEELMQKGLAREMQAELYAVCSRPPSVYRGNPFLVEAGLAFGGALAPEADEEDEGAATEGEGPIRLVRVANRVPLQYQQSACAIFRAVVESNWRQYGLSQPRGQLPVGPAVLMVHIASVWVPFTSESKEAVAHYPEIVKEVKLALREVGRKLLAHIRHRERRAWQDKRRSIFSLYIPEVAGAIEKLTGVRAAQTARKLQAMAQRHTGAADGADQEAGTDELAGEGSAASAPAREPGEDDDGA